MRVDVLLWTGTEPASLPDWPLGRVHLAAPEPAAADRQLRVILEAGDADFVLFWDPALGAPDSDAAATVAGQPGDFWHAGLRLGMAALPRLLDPIRPVWMFNCDPDPQIEATSWRVSLRAAMVRAEVLRVLGGIDPGFRSLAGAGLELGLRCIHGGTVLRHVPWLVPAGVADAAPALPLEDEVRCVVSCFGRRWGRWALLRSVLSGDVAPLRALAAYRSIATDARPRVQARRVSDRPAQPPTTDSPPRVSVLIPTIERYPYLRTLLSQLRHQTISPHEIVVVDQTPPEARDARVAEEFPDLPLRWLVLDSAGQCTSRNAGLARISGDYVLFIDDDDEVKPDLIERHLESLAQHRCEVSSGWADEAGSDPADAASDQVRVSDVFPTNNTLIHKRVLHDSGLFDLAYDRGARADGDLGMRVYLAGTLMVIDTSIRVLHHHAPRGGLRVHKARVITRGSSRSRLTHRHLPSTTEIYLARRYFTPRQVREMLWLRVVSTFSLRGPRYRRMLKVLISLVLLPHSLWVVHSRCRAAAEMLRNYPQIPRLGGPVADNDERAGATSGEAPLQGYTR